MAALQHLQPSLRGHLAGAWRLLKTWAINEIPNRAPPIPEQVVRAMPGWAFSHGRLFYAEIGRVDGVEFLPHYVFLKGETSLDFAGNDLGRKHRGTAESVVLGVESAFRLTHHWQRLAPAGTPFCTNPSKWRFFF